jgi:hypothetical protein
MEGSPHAKRLFPPKYPGVIKSNLGGFQKKQRPMGGGEVCGSSSRSIPGFPCEHFCCSYRHVVVESVKLLSWIDRRNAIHITVAQVDFTLKALEPLTLPPYKGSTLRGGFGAAFRRITVHPWPVSI